MEGRISSFKKFSEMNETKIVPADNSISIQADDNTSMPMLPDNKTKINKVTNTRNIKPTSDNGIDYKKTEEEQKAEEAGIKEKVKFIGKVAKLPKNTLASKGLNFLENVKISKSSIWYIIVERQENELQMLKYNLKEGFDLSKFTNELKSYYSKKFSSNKNLVKLIESIKIDGDDKFSWIKNVPLIEIEGRKLITIITEDLIRLLSR